MLSSESDLFQEKSMNEISPKSSEDFLNKNSNQYLVNSSFLSQQSGVFQSIINNKLRPKRVIKRKIQTKTSFDDCTSSQDLAKSNKTVIFSRKSLQKQPYINCNQSFTNFSNITSSMTLESQDTLCSDTTDECYKKYSSNNIDLEIDSEEEYAIENQLEKKFNSPLSLTKDNELDINNEQNKSFSSISPTKYSNHTNLLKTLCNPKIKNKKRQLCKSVNKSLSDQNKMSSNQKFNTLPVFSKPNQSQSKNNLTIDQSNKVLPQKSNVRSKSVYLSNQNKTDSVSVQQNQNSNQNQSTNIHKLHSLHTSSSCVDQKQVNVQALKKQIEDYLDRSNLSEIKKEYRGIIPSNPPSFINMYPRNINSPLKRRPLQAVKPQNKQFYETEAMNLIQQFESNTVSAYPQVQNSCVNTQLRKGSIRRNKQFTDSLFNLSSQITQVEKSMLSSYYKDKEFIRITSA